MFFSFKNIFQSWDIQIQILIEKSESSNNWSKCFPYITLENKNDEDFQDVIPTTTYIFIINVIHIISGAYKLRLISLKSRQICNKKRLNTH